MNDTTQPTAGTMSASRILVNPLRSSTFTMVRKYVNAQLFLLNKLYIQTGRVIAPLMADSRSSDQLGLPVRDFRAQSRPSGAQG